VMKAKTAPQSLLLPARFCRQEQLPQLRQHV
jgi:hypothetical protein